MDGHRRYDEPEPGWYSGQGSYESPQERPSGAFRLPEQRPADAYSSPYSSPDPLTSTGGYDVPTPESTGTRIPVRGPEYPAVRPSGATSLEDAQPMYGGASAPSSGLPAAGPPAGATEQMSVVPPRMPGESVYRTRRPVSALLIVAITLLLLVPVVMLLVQVTFVDDPAVRGIVPAVLLTLGLPLTGGGLYALAAGGPAGRDVWLRPPIIYLPVGLVLLLAAGLSVA